MAFWLLSVPGAESPPYPFHIVWIWESTEAAGASLTSSCPPTAGWPGPASVDVSELERRQLEEALEAAQGEARGAQLREEQLQAECERLQGELKQLQETRAQVEGLRRSCPWMGRAGRAGEG